MQPGDSMLAQRLREDIAEVIAGATNKLIDEPSERQAGYIKGLRDALLLIAQTVEQLDGRRLDERHPTR